MPGRRRKGGGRFAAGREERIKKGLTSMQTGNKDNRMDKIIVLQQIDWGREEN